MTPPSLAQFAHCASGGEADEVENEHENCQGADEDGDVENELDDD